MMLTYNEEGHISPVSIYVFDSSKAFGLNSREYYSPSYWKSKTGRAGGNKLSAPYDYVGT